MRTDLTYFVLYDKLQRVTNGLCVQCDLIIGLGIHEIEKVTIGIRVLHVLSVDTRLRALLGRTEGSLDYAAILNVLQLGTHKRSALTGFYVLELHDLKNIIIQLNGHAISEITCRNHKKISS